MYVYLLYYIYYSKNNSKCYNILYIIYNNIIYICINSYNK